jgi:hypothetical protein
MAPRAKKIAIGLLIVPGLVPVLLGCGAMAKTSTTLPPGQKENALHILGYAKSLRETMTPFTHPPAGPTNYAAANRELQAATSRLSALTPPPPFSASHERILHGLLGQLALGGKLEQAARSHDTLAITNLVAKLQPYAESIRAGLAESNQVLRRCVRSRYSCLRVGASVEPSHQDTAL